MSVDSALIVRRAVLPTIEQLTAVIAETGVIVEFPHDFALDQNVGGWVPLTVDGQESGFNFSVQPLSGVDLAEMPDGVAEAGDTLLAFGGQGTLSAETVSLIHEVMGRRYRAWLLIEDELLPPEDSWGHGAALDDIHVDRRGSPAKLAGDVEAYVAQHYPPIPRDPHARTKDLLKQLIVPILIFAALGGFYLWSQLK
jgi:hypothetical protein